MQQLVINPDVRLVTLQPPYRFTSPFDGVAYVLLLHSDDPNLSTEVQNTFADQIVASGCRYACCSGIACSSWNDAIDWAFIVTDPNFQPSKERFVLTTWHARESLSDVAWFALKNTSFDNFVAERFLIVLLSPDAGREDEVRAAATASAG